jgi:hypothetical protein
LVAPIGAPVQAVFDPDEGVIVPEDGVAASVTVVKIRPRTAMDSTFLHGMSGLDMKYLLCYVCNGKHVYHIRKN